DYYCHTAFEFVTHTLGAQGTVLGGGRYDTLMKQMGGPDTSGIGWAAGIERLCLMIQNTTLNDRTLITVIPMSDQEELASWKIAQMLRTAGLYVDMGYSGNLSKRLKKAAQNNSIVAVIIGNEELVSNTVQVKFLNENRQESVSVDVLVTFLTSTLSI